MGQMIDPSRLHRTAKYFMDNGRAGSHDEAMRLLARFGLTIYVGPEIIGSANHQNALLTLVNTARRTLLAGVDVVGLPDAPSLSPLAPERLLKDAVRELGGRVVDTMNPDWPSAVIGGATVLETKLPRWCVTWNGWRGGVIPFRENRRLHEDESIALAPLLAAAACAAEVFAYHAGDHAMAGRRSLGLSLWNPGADWLLDDPTESASAFLPSRLWIIGLGNLGQAFAWLLASLPYADRAGVELVLNDFDDITLSNDSTSLLSHRVDIGHRKARVVAKWLEDRGFRTLLEERLFGEWIVRAPHEPGVALCGVDNALARAALEKPGFGLVIEAGLGGGPEAFRSISIHTFPASRSAEEIWSRQVGQGDKSPEDMPAYRELKKRGMDSCGLAQLASRTVGVPFVGVIAACLVIAELLRRLNGGSALELVSGSVAALEDIETVSIPSGPYSFGHLPAIEPSVTLQSESETASGDVAA
jgi:hypothetical protein